MSEYPEIYCSSEMGQLMAEGVEEIIGPVGFQAVLNLAKISHLYHRGPEEDQVSILPFADLTALQDALEEAYGPRGGRGIALRAGRAAFTHLVQRHEAELGWSGIAFRLQPTQMRLTTGLKDLAGLLSRLCETEFVVEVDPRCWRLRVELCPFCWQRSASEAVCHFLVGLVQEYFAWASSGKYHPVAEVECKAAGSAACVLQIEKTPLD